MKKERLRGVNLGGWFSQVDCIQEKDPVGFPGVVPHIETFLGKSDFERIRKAGFNHVRLPVDYFNLFKGENDTPDEEVFKLLDKALCEMGVQGRTMGDRLKKIGKERLTQLNAVWHAHKLRNQIAHESDFHPEYRQAQHALATYRQALKDLGAI